MNDARGFGDNGQVVLDVGMNLVWPGEFQITSPPVVIDDTVIVGSAISDNVRVRAPHGTIRAFDVRTGEPKWDFDPIPREVGNPEWQGSTASGRRTRQRLGTDVRRSNENWSVCPTSSPSPDFYGGLRPGDNRYANSVVALNADSGTVNWAYQIVHHDVWDYDLPAQPGLYTVWRDGAAHDVVAQVTKTGHVFVLDRDTGEPFLPVKEVPVPASDVEGEVLSPTQPLPDGQPAACAEPYRSRGCVWFNLVRQECLSQNAAGAARRRSVHATVDTGTLFHPFTGGGANWGGAAYDPRRNLLIINMSSLAHVVQLFASEEYRGNLKVFHGQDVEPMRGAPYSDRRGVLLSHLVCPVIHRRGE